MGRMCLFPSAVESKRRTVSRYVVEFVYLCVYVHVVNVYGCTLVYVHAWSVSSINLAITKIQVVEGSVFYYLYLNGSGHTAVDSDFRLQNEYAK